jgi:ATP-binding protein involved in chromosome partitioning
MVTREEAFEKLKHLQDPLLHKSLIELNLIRDMMIRDERISLTLVLTQSDESVNAKLEKEIKDVLSDAAKDIHIRLRTITDFEKSELENKLNGGEKKQPQGKPQHTHGANLQSNILEPESGVTFIAVASGKGGVGKSTVTVNLATALARKGKKVGLIDADIYGFSVPDMMGIEEYPKQEDQKIVPVERFGVKVISMGFFVEENAPVIWRGPMLGKMLRNFFSEVVWGELDYLLLDLPPGTGDIALDVHQMIPQSKEIIVTTPHATASFVAARAGAMAIHTKHELLGVVENMSYYQCGDCGNKEYVFGRGGGAKLAEELKTTLLAEIPLRAPDNHISEADYSPSVYKEDSEIGKIYLEMAESVIGKTNE